MKYIHDFSRSLWNAIQERNIEEFNNLTHDNALFIHMGVTFDRDREAHTIAEGHIIYQDINLKKKQYRKWVQSQSYSIK